MNTQAKAKAARRTLNQQSAILSVLYTNDQIDSLANALTGALNELDDPMRRGPYGATATTLVRLGLPALAKAGRPFKTFRSFPVGIIAQKVGVEIHDIVAPLTNRIARKAKP